MCPSYVTGTTPNDLNCMTLLKLVSPYVGTLTTDGTVSSGAAATLRPVMHRASSVSMETPLAGKDIGSKLSLPTLDHRFSGMCNTTSHWENKKSHLQHKLRL